MTKDDPTSAAFLESITADPREWGPQADGPIVLEQVDGGVWHVIAAADIDSECPGAHTPWDL